MKQSFIKSLSHSALALAALTALSGCIFDHHIFLAKSICEQPQKSQAQALVGTYEILKSNQGNENESGKDGKGLQMLVELSQEADGDIRARLLNPEFEEVRKAPRCEGDSVQCQIDQLVRESISFVETVQLSPCSVKGVEGLVLEHKDSRGSNTFGYAVAKAVGSNTQITFWVPNIENLAATNVAIETFDTKTKQRSVLENGWSILRESKDWLLKLRETNATLIVDNSEFEAKELLSVFAMNLDSDDAGPQYLLKRVK